MRKPSVKITKAKQDEVVALLEQGVNLRAACQQVNISWQGFHRCRKADPDLDGRVVDAWDGYKDHCSRLAWYWLGKALEAGEWPAVKLQLEHELRREIANKDRDARQIDVQLAFAKLREAQGDSDAYFAEYPAGPPPPEYATMQEVPDGVGFTPEPAQPAQLLTPWQQEQARRDAVRAEARQRIAQREGTYIG